MEIIDLPRFIHQDDYIDTKYGNNLKKEDIEKYLDEKLNNEIEKERQRLKEEALENILDDITMKEANSILKKFLETSYLLDEVSKDNSKNSESVKCLNNFTTIANSILREAKKKSKEDADIVLEKIKKRLSSSSLDVLLDKIKEDKYNEDREDLDIYVDEKCLSILNGAISCVNDLSKEKANDYFKDNKESIDKKIEDELSVIINSELKDFKENLKCSIQNTFNYVKNRYLNAVNFIDEGKYMIMVTNRTFEITDNKVSYMSSKVFKNTYSFDISKNDYFVRYGETLTYVRG